MRDVEMIGWFIEQDDRGLLSEGSGELRSLPLSARERVPALVTSVGKACSNQRSLYRVDVSGREWVEPAPIWGTAESNNLFYGQFGMGFTFLLHDSHALRDLPSAQR